MKISEKKIEQASHKEFGDDTFVKPSDDTSYYYPVNSVDDSIERRVDYLKFLETKGISIEKYYDSEAS